MDDGKLTPPGDMFSRQFVSVLVLWCIISLLSSPLY
jgi:hypothetical protein